MACTVGKIVQIMEKIAPSSQAEKWDNVGLMLGSADLEVKKLMTTVDITPAVVKEAIDNKINMIIAHHPLIFKPLYTLDSNSMAGRLIYPLIEHRIAVYCAHTNLDKAKGGTDDSLAETLGLRAIHSLDNVSDDLSFGRIGMLEKPVELMQFAQNVCNRLRTRSIEIVGKKEKKVQKIAVCGGAGASLIKKAIDAGADVLVTGEIKHHEAIEADMQGISILAAGHFYTELPVMIKLINRLQMILDDLQYNVDVVLSKLQKSPYTLLQVTDIDDFTGEV